MTSAQKHSAADSGKNIFIIGALFFVFGFVTWLGSILIPYLKIACELTTVQSYLVTFSFFISYTFMALPSAWVLKRTGAKKGMSLGLLIMGIGSLIFIPAALNRFYFLFLSGLFIQGAGLTILQSASNPYITKLGSPDKAAMRMSIMGISNGVAGVIAPLILGAIILKDADSFQHVINSLAPGMKQHELNTLALRVVLPYCLMALALMLLSAWIYFSGLPELKTDEEDLSSGLVGASRKSIFNYPHLLLGVIAVFLYVGVEVIAVDTIYGYAVYQGMSLAGAKFFTSLTILNMLGGYIIGIVGIPRFMKQENALKLSAVAGVAFVLLIQINTGVTSIIAVALLGLANALIWPSIWPLAISGLGKFTRTGSSMLVMAIGGGAVLPLIYGKVSELSSPQLAYWVALPSYLFIFYYAAHGWKAGKGAIQFQAPMPSSPQH